MILLRLCINLLDTLARLCWRWENVENISIDKLGFSTRTRNSLYREKIDTLDKIMMLSEDELFHIRNMGKKSVSEVLKFQKQYIYIEHGN